MKEEDQQQAPENWYVWSVASRWRRIVSVSGVHSKFAGS
jgi:hypothetical protein